MTREESLAIASMLIEAYPREVKAETLKAYALHLADLDKQAAGEAVKALVATSKWLPTIAEVRQYVAKQALPPALAVEIAWSQAVGLMESIGSYRTLGDAGTPYVNHALRLCGRWDDICQEDATWLRKRFVEIYESVVRNAQETMQITGEAPAWLERHMSAISDERREYTALLGKLSEHFTPPEDRP